VKALEALSCRPREATRLHHSHPETGCGQPCRTRERKKRASETAAARGVRSRPNARGSWRVRGTQNSKDHTFFFLRAQASQTHNTKETRAELSTRTTGCPGPRTPSRGAGLSPGVWIEGGSIQFSVGHIGSVQSEVARTSLAWAICVVHLHPSWGLRPALE
jgi:hypothetical protein